MNKVSKTPVINLTPSMRTKLSLLSEKAIGAVIKSIEAVLNAVNEYMPKPKPEDKYNLDEKKLRSLSLEKQKEFLMAANNSIFFEDESYTISDVMQDIYKLNGKSLSLLNDGKPATREEAEKIVEENGGAIPTKEEFEMIEKLILSYRALRIRNSISELNGRFWSAELEGEYAHTFTLGERDYRLVPLRYNDIYLVLSLGKN